MSTMGGGGGMELAWQQRVLRFKARDNFQDALKIKIGLNARA